MSSGDDQSLKLKEMDPDFASKAKQQARCFLRERFLRATTSVVGKECTFHMYSNTKVNGIFKGNDIEYENILVDKLKTPVAEIPHSKIRSSDVVYLSFDNFLEVG